MNPDLAPYKGLIPYQEEDAELFFGRDAERDLVVANLMASRFTVVYGISGVGKSSLLRAGVKHYLRGVARENQRTHGTPQLGIVVFSAWRDNPLPSLLHGIAQGVAEAWQIADASRLDVSAGRHLDEALRVGAENVDGEFVVILDQFEDYFQSHSGQDDPNRFDLELSRAIANEAVRASFLISIREDALAKLDCFEDRIPNLFGNLLRIEHLDRNAARRAIVEPVALYNKRVSMTRNGPLASIEPALVETVLDEVRTGQVTLGDTHLTEASHVTTRPFDERERIEAPYLQLVMKRLWEAEVGDAGAAQEITLRQSTLERLGGAEHIVHTHLDATMDGLTPRERAIAARVFSYLVTPSRTKIAQSAPDLAEYAEVTPAELDPVLARLCAARILTPIAANAGRGAVRYEIFHDVLAAGVLDWRRRYLRDRERDLAGRQLAVERHRVWHLRRRVISLSGLLVAVVILAVFALLQTETVSSAEQVALSREASQRLESVFVACFAFGALFTLVSALLGVHGLHAGHLGGGHHAGASSGGSPGARRVAASPTINPSALLAFLTWFGAAGYLLERYAEWGLAAVLMGACAAGAAGWYLITRFLDLILAGEREMNPEDYRLEGTIGRVTVAIPAGGTGEVVFSKGGVRRSEAARAVTGPVARGTEVLITNYANGFATVEPWNAFLEEHSLA
jgi:hypothetical protein